MSHRRGGNVPVYGPPHLNIVSTCRCDRRPYVTATTTTLDADPRYFEPSAISAINKHTEHIYEGVLWKLAIDHARFHVYAVAIISPDLWVRVDWNETHKLTFKPYVVKEREIVIDVGFSDGFCKLCLEKEIYLEDYKLFEFNCRTVTFIVLTLMGFDSPKLYAMFTKNNVLCGLDESKCLSVDEITHFIQWQEGRVMKGESPCNTQ